MVSYDGLDVRLVIHIRHELVTGFVSHLARHGRRYSLLQSIEILHIYAMSVFQKISDECGVLRVYKKSSTYTYP